MVSRKFVALALLSAALGGGFIPAARAQESIWSALVLATNEEHPKKSPPELEQYCDKLKNIFTSYNQFELLGQHTELMDSPKEHWLIPRNDFLLHVDSRKAEKPGFYRMKFDLYQEKKLLAEMEMRVAGQNLFFIGGPRHDSGRFIIILMVK